jgi:hypothetical protein
VAFSENLHRIVDLVAPYWAGEQEIARTYFESSVRSVETDRLWIRRQCYKEIWGSGVRDGEGGLFLGPLAQLRDAFPRIDRGVDRHEVLETIEILRSEFHHYCLFADLHDELGGTKIDPSQLTGWPADDALARQRARCRAAHGPLGDAAVRITEGGYGSMYAAGMQLAGSGGRDDRIAAACARVYSDEIDHMQLGIAALARQEPAARDWDAVAGLIEAMVLQRLHMRNEQFGEPVSLERIHEIQQGAIEPMAFDFDALDLAGPRDPVRST